MVASLQSKNITNGADHLKEKTLKFISKTRTAFFQGREDDEHMASQIIQFGSFLFDAKKSNMKEGVLSNTATLGAKLIFQGINLC